ncbi:Non-histone chromosomal protein [Entamoeba marina]
MPRATKKDSKKDKKSKRAEKKAKKVKDPNKPKKAPTAFFIFLSEKREQIKTDFPELKVTQISKKASEMWNALDENDKKDFKDKAEAAKKQHEKDMEAYNAKKANGSEESDD